MRHQCLLELRTLPLVYGTCCLPSGNPEAPHFRNSYTIPPSSVLGTVRPPSDTAHSLSSASSVTCTVQVRQSLASSGGSLSWQITFQVSSHPTVEIQPLISIPHRRSTCPCPKHGKDRQKGGFYLCKSALPQFSLLLQSHFFSIQVLTGTSTSPYTPSV